MRHLPVLLFCIYALLPMSGSAGRASQTAQPSIIDNPAPFAIELPEIQSGLLTATSVSDIFIPPGAQITRLKLWVLQPYDRRFGYEIKATLNRKALATVAQRRAGPCGNFLDINLREQPTLRLDPGRNVVEIVGYEAESRLSYRASFVLLPGTNKTPRPAPVPEKAEIRFEQVLAYSDSPVPNEDRTAPQLTLTVPAAPPTSSDASFSLRIAGFARDDSGTVTSVAVNGQIIAKAGPPAKEDKNKKKDKNAAAAPPAERKLEFDQTITVTPNTCALLIEARDQTGNRALAYVPINRSAPLARLDDFGGRRYAVVVGVSQYQFHEGGLNNLQFAHKDAEAIRDWLRTDGGGGFKSEDIVCLTDSNATLASVRRELKSFLTKAGSNDLIYLFLAGHGAPDPRETDKLYFLLHDSKVNDLPNTALPMREIGSFLNAQSQQARLIAFFDTCHSAGIKGQPLNKPVVKPAAAQAPRSSGTKQGPRGVGTKNPNAPGNSLPPPQPTPKPAPAPATKADFNFYETALFREKGWTVITSSGMNEESQESTKWNGHGVFTWALLEGAQGKADANGDCKVTAGELAQYVTATVSRETGQQQTPQSLPGSSGNLEVAAVRGPNCKKTSFIPHPDEKRSVFGRNTGITQSVQRSIPQALPVFEAAHFSENGNHEPALTTQTTASERIATAKSRALLVGIDHYQNAPAVKPTRGAEADAVETAAFVQQQYGFRKDEIRLLLGKEATAANIKAEFQHWLIEGTQPGDRVFFLYAGHGSQMKDINGDEADGLDEVLAPYDVNWRGESFANVIVDDELDEMVRQLSGRRAVLVFDSCNSGTISRTTPGARPALSTDGDARYLPSPEEAQKLGLGMATRGQPVEYVVSEERILTTKSGPFSISQKERNLKLIDVSLTNAAAGIVVISAAQSVQSAYSMNVGGGKQRGALSFAFAEAQRRPTATLSELRRNITQQIADWQKSGRLRGNQRPECEAAVALENKSLFAETLTIPETAFVNPQSKLRVTLRTREKKQSYKLGDDISYEVTTNASGWLYLFVFSQEQKASFIFPNHEDRDNYFKPGTHRLPRESSFIAIPPSGKDVIIALLSTVDLKLGVKEEMTWQEVFDLLGSKKLTGYVNARGIGTKKNSLSYSTVSLAGADWQADSLVIETTSTISSQPISSGAVERQINGLVSAVNGTTVFITDIDKSIVQVGDSLFVRRENNERNPGVLSSEKIGEVKIVEIQNGGVWGLFSGSGNVQKGDIVTNNVQAPTFTQNTAQLSSSPKTGNALNNTPISPEPALKPVERYPFIDCPDTVAETKDFAVQIFLLLEPQKALAVIKQGTTTQSGGIALPLPRQAEQQPWKIEVVLSAPDFEFIGGPNTNIGTILLHPVKNSPPAIFRLKSKKVSQISETSEISATLWHAGDFLGQISRTIKIASAGKTDQQPSSTARPAPPGSNDNAIKQDEEITQQSSVKSLPTTKPGKTALLAEEQNASATAIPIVNNSPEESQPIGVMLAIDPKRKSPDLTIRIRERFGKRTAMRAEIEIHSPYLETTVSTFEIGPDVARWLEAQYETFAQHSGRDLKKIEAGTNYPKSAYTDALLQGFGRELYKKLAPQIFRDAFWKLVDDLRGDFTSIQIVSDNPTIPWELMRPVRATGTGERSFLGVEFNIGRRHLAEGVTLQKKPPQKLAIDRLSVIAPQYSDKAALKYQADEVAALKQMRGYRAVGGRFPEVRGLFAGAPQGIIHFAGHAGVLPSNSTIKNFALQLEDGPLSVQAWQGLVTGKLSAHPFFFFNACHIGQTQRVANFVNGWAPAVLDAGASGYVGALWPVNDRGAYEFAKKFYEILEAKLKSGSISVAEALRQTRETFLKTGDPTFLAYVYYGDPNLTFYAQPVR